MKCYDNALPIIPGAGHAVHHHLMPLFWAAPVLDHYLHHFRCCNQQMEQPQWKPFLSISENGDLRSKGDKERRGQERRKWRERKYENCERNWDSIQHNKTKMQRHPREGVYEEKSKSVWSSRHRGHNFSFCPVVLNITQEQRHRM